MWNVFKFFFLWFWLAVAALVFWFALIAITTSGPMDAPLVPGSATGGMVAIGLGSVTGFLMCIPAYFLARPKRDDQGVIERYQ